jgi:hypothetical protein
MSLFLLYLFLACIIAGGYQWYCHHRDNAELKKQAKADILRGYEPEIFEELTYRPLRTNGERILFIVHLTISVTSYHTRYRAQNAVMPLVKQALAVWTASLTDQESFRAEWFESVRLKLSPIATPIAKLKELAVLTIVPLNSKQPDTLDREMDEAAKSLVQCSVLEKRYPHDAAVQEFVRQRREALKGGILDPAVLQ